MKTTLILMGALTLSLAGCGSAPQKAQAGLRPFPDSPDPIVDMASLPPERLPAFQSSKLECRKLQEKAMPFSFLRDAFGASDVKAYERRREDQAAAIMRRCLEGRGFTVLN